MHSSCFGKRSKTNGLRGWCGDLATVLCQAVGVSKPQTQDEFPALFRHRLERHLGDKADLVFDIDLQVVAQSNRARLVENGQEFSGAQAMIHIIGHPGLQAAKRIGPKHPAAVDVVLLHPRHFRDMRVDRKEGAIRPLESQERTGVPGQEGSEFQEFHGGRGAGEVAEESAFG